MPSEPLPFDRKELLKERKPSSSDTVRTVPTRWREPPNSPSQHNIHGFHQPISEANSTPLQSPSGDAAYRVAPRIADDASCRKKPRLGWGDGLAKYERKNLGPDETEAGVNSGSRSGPLHPSSFARSSSPGSVFVKSTAAIDKLHVWKADIAKTLEITESEIDSLENDLNSSIFDVGSSCPFPAVEPIALCDNVMRFGAVDQRDSAVNLDIRSAKCSVYHASDHMLGPVTSFGDVHYGREDKLYNSILNTNKMLAHRASDEFNKILPTKHLCNNILRDYNELLVKRKIAMRKRFLKFKEKVMALKFRAFHYFWKKELRLLSKRRFCAKPRKNFEFGYTDRQNYHSSLSCRLSSSEAFNYLKKLLSTSRVRIYRNAMKMPSFILDRRERMASMFISDNRLVKNPIDVEKKRSMVNPWMVEEKKVFLEKYSVFRKDFKKIASFLKYKTIADCVEFYYKNHKSDHFQKTKKKSVFAKRKSSTANTYLVTSGRRLNRETGATSAMAANVDGTPNLYVGHTSSSCGDDNISKSSIARRCQKLGGTLKRLNMAPEGSSLNDVDEGTCSDDSCGEEAESSYWTDKEKSRFIKAVRIYGKDFPMISKCVRTRSSDQCRVFFSKSWKCLGLYVFNFVPGGEGNLGGGGEDDHEDASMVHCGSVISRHNSSPDGKIDIEDLHLHPSDFREEHDAECDLRVLSCCEVEDLYSSSHHSLELSTDVHESVMKLNDSEKVIASEEPGNGFLMSKNSIPQDPPTNRRTLSQDDVSRPSFRKSGDSLSQRSSSTDGYHLHLPKHLLLDCLESFQILGGYPVNKPNVHFSLDLIDCFIRKCPGLISDGQAEVHCSSDVEKPSRCGDVKHFGQILTRCSSLLQRLKERDQGSLEEKTNFFNLKV